MTQKKVIETNGDFVGSFFLQYPGLNRNKDPGPDICYLVDWTWFTAVVLG